MFLLPVRLNPLFSFWPIRLFTNGQSKLSCLANFSLTQYRKPSSVSMACPLMMCIGSYKFPSLSSFLLAHHIHHLGHRSTNVSSGKFSQPPTFIISCELQGSLSYQLLILVFFFFLDFPFRIKSKNY